MPAERASVPSASDIPTHERRDIPPDAANSAALEPGDGHQETGRSGLRLVLILVASFMVVLDFTIVNIALPSIEHDFGLRTSAVQWVVTGYAIAFGGLLILGGRAADLLGRRRTFVAGLVVFSLASLAGGLAGDPVLLVAARVVQGAGAALVAPAALSLITTSFPPGPRRTRAIGLYGSWRRSASSPARCSAAYSSSGRAGGRCSLSTSRSGSAAALLAPPGHRRARRAGTRGEHGTRPTRHQRRRRAKAA